MRTAANRADFVAWAKRTHGRPGTNFDTAHDGTFKDNRIAAKWAAWRASADQPINLNSQFKVTLTAYGAEVWNARYSELIGKGLVESVAPGEQIAEELWQLMLVFGPVLSMGNTQIPFEGLKIEAVALV